MVGQTNLDRADGKRDVDTKNRCIALMFMAVSVRPQRRAQAAMMGCCARFFSSQRATLQANIVAATISLSNIIMPVVASASHLRVDERWSLTPGRGTEMGRTKFLLAGIVLLSSPLAVLGQKIEGLNRKDGNYLREMSWHGRRRSIAARRWNSFSLRQRNGPASGTGSSWIRAGDGRTVERTGSCDGKKGSDSIAALFASSGSLRD
jgi:hypothetical protein